jgi:protein-tyrosine phosphatase
MAKFGFNLDESARAALRKEFSPEPMRTLLGALGEDPLATLREAGLTDALIAQLRARAVS